MVMTISHLLTLFNVGLTSTTQWRKADACEKRSRTLEKEIIIVIR